ncbi:hypothetical protein BD769DRAFT_1397340 [Suillus cothurnatus]|nr:hypothetical protein BD769DRAFT_1397340 [Suillus cothurnatus]
MAGTDAITLDTIDPDRKFDPIEIPLVPGYLNTDIQGLVLWSIWVTYLNISAQRGSSWRDRLPSGHDVLVYLQYGLGKAVRYLRISRRRTKITSSLWVHDQVLTGPEDSSPAKKTGSGTRGVKANKIYSQLVENICNVSCIMVRKPSRYSISTFDPRGLRSPNGTSLRRLASLRSMKQITSNILKGVEKIASQHPEGNGTNQKSCETRRTEVQGNACLQPDVFRSLPALNGVG